MGRRAGRRAVDVVAGLLVVLVLAEVGVRLFQPIPTQRLLPLFYPSDALERIATNRSFFRFDPDLGWSLTPGMVRRTNTGVTFRTNGDGLRAAHPHHPEPPPGVRRLAAFGDSFVHCYEVDDPYCWTDALEEAWPGTQVLNFGVPVYGPDQAWLRYQRDGRGYHPCGVLLGYMVENVHRVVNRFRAFYQPTTDFLLPKPRFLVDGGGLRLLPNPAATPEQLEDPRWVEATLGPHDAWYFPGLFVPHALDALHLVRVARTAAYRRHIEALGGADEYLGRLHEAYLEAREGYQVAGRVLIEFARQVRQDGASPVVVVFGRMVDVVAVSQGEPKAYQPLLDWLAREEIPTIDVTDRLAREALRTEAAELFAPQQHYSEQGNAVVASTLARRLPDLVSGTCDTGQ